MTFAQATTWELAVSHRGGDLKKDCEELLGVENIKQTKILQIIFNLEQLTSPQLPKNNHEVVLSK